MSRYQKGKNNLDFSEATDSAWQWHQLGYMQVCISLQAGNHTSTPPLLFYRPDALPAAQPTVSKCSSKNVHIFGTVRISRGTGSIKWSSVRLSLCPSVRPSVCPVVRQQERRVAGLLLSALRAGDISREQAPVLSSNGAAARRTAANAGSVMLTAELTRLNTDLSSE